MIYFKLGGSGGVNCGVVFLSVVVVVVSVVLVPKLVVVLVMSFDKAGSIINYLPIFCLKKNSGTDQRTNGQNLS